MSDAFVDYVMELLGRFGTATARRMFGAHGIYLDGLMFAIVSDDTLYLKADDMNRVEFEQAGCEAFSYARKGARATLSFFRAPEDAMESPELMLPWARTAYAAALRSNAKRAAGKARAAGSATATASKRIATGKKHPAKAARKKIAETARLAIKRK
jgi:DNA transformation protein